MEGSIFKPNSFWVDNRMFARTDTTIVIHVVCKSNAVFDSIRSAFETRQKCGIRTEKEHDPLAFQINKTNELRGQFRPALRPKGHAQRYQTNLRVSMTDLRPAREMVDVPPSDHSHQELQSSLGPFHSAYLLSSDS